TTSASFVFSGVDDITPPGSLTFACKLDSGGFGACTSPKDYAGLTDGSHTFQVQATDGTGHTEVSPASFTWNIDTVPPDTSITAQPSNPTTSLSAPFSFSGSDDVAVASLECKLDGQTFAPCPSPKNYSNLPTGSHTFSVRAIDTAGNVDASPATYT